jgi:hypothetical protein
LAAAFIVRWNGWPFRNQQVVTGDLPDLVEAFLRKMGPMLRLKVSHSNAAISKSYIGIRNGCIRSAPTASKQMGTYAGLRLADLNPMT